MAGPLEPVVDEPDPHRADQQLPTVRHRPPHVPAAMQSYDVPGAADATMEIPRLTAIPDQGSSTAEIPRQPPVPERNFDLRPGASPPPSPHTLRRLAPPVVLPLPDDELPPEQGPGPVF